MNITRACLSNPVAMLVAVLLVLIFGLISLFRLPIQLTPELEEPEITITTPWRAASLMKLKPKSLSLRKMYYVVCRD